MRRRRATVAAMCCACAALSACAPDLRIGEIVTGTGGTGGATSTSSTAGIGGGTGGSTGGSLTSGEVLWLGTFAGSDDTIVTGAAVTADNVVLASELNFDAAGTPIAAVESFANEGSVVAGEALQGYGPQLWYGVTASSDGDAIVAGQLFGTTDWDVAATSYLESAGGCDCLVGRISSTGSVKWLRKLGTEGYSACVGAITGTNDDIFVAGTFTDVLDETFTVNGGVVNSAGGEDVFVAKYDANGDFQTAWRFGDEATQLARAIGRDGSGILYILGDDQPPYDYYASDVWLLKIDEGGGIVGERRYGFENTERALALAVAPDGTTAIAGTLSEPFSLGGDVLGGDAWVAVFDPEGNHVWSHALHDVQGLDVYALAFDDDLALYVAGDFAYELGFAGESRVSDGDYDAFIAKVAPDGTLAWLKTFGNPQDQAISGLAIAPDGTLAATGHSQGELDFDGLQFSATGYDSFAIGISP